MGSLTISRCRQCRIAAIRHSSDSWPTPAALIAIEITRRFSTNQSRRVLGTSLAISSNSVRRADTARRAVRVNKKIIFDTTRFISFKDVERITGMSRSTIYREVKKGKFPRPRLISARKVGFLQGEFESWIQQRQIV